MEKNKVASQMSMKRMIGLRNALFKLGLLIPVEYPGGDLKYVVDEIEFAMKMEIKYVLSNGSN